MMKKSGLIALFMLLVTGSSNAQSLIEVYSSDDKREVFIPVEGLANSRDVEYSTFEWKNYVTQGYVRAMTDEQRRYINLEPKMAKEVLRDINLSTHDSLFYYNYHYNESYSIPVSKLRPIGMLNEYALEEGTDLLYDAGLAFDQSLLTNITSHYSYAYAAVGQENPFIKKGDVEVVEWKEIPKDKLILSSERIDESANENSYCGSQHWKLQKVFKSQYAKYDLFSYDLVGEGGCYGYLVVIANKGTKTVIHTRFFQSSESKYLNEINPDRADMNEYNDAYGRMRIGKFMKDVAPKILGTTEL